ncbi:YslB family protein [Weissella ceti]|uniref:YslB family protein n=1 Tax=Weissella ceti TaxID=759620 RepID=A0ABT3E4L8_9LACO|nr:DUF2507 domain-containing protein [Weissella ceti]MCW0953162.1 YslB family protein [Weissella ceti]QVK12681.1 DUF2507 domain-containing protein [Weissella ceti]
MDTMVNSENAAFPLEVLRDRLLPNLFQENESEISYWAGKSLAQTETFSSDAQIIEFFAAAGFGELEALKTTTTHADWRLSGPIVTARAIDGREASFSLEAGFLAQAMEMVLNRSVEVTSELSRKKDYVKLTVLIGLPDDELV